MLDRFLQLQSHVRRVLTDSYREDLLLTKPEVDTIEKAVVVLKPFDDATVEMSTEKTTSVAKKIPIINGLRYTLEENGSTVAKKLLAHLKERFLNLETSNVSSAATLLDPRFMKLAFLDDKAADDRYC